MQEIVKSDLDKFGQTLNKHDEQIRTHENTLTVHQGRLDLIDSSLKELQGLNNEYEKRISANQIIISSLKETKVDQVKFDIIL